MEKIPFDIQKFNAGLKPVYRNGEIPKRVILTPDAKENSKIISIDKFSDVIKHSYDGLHTESGMSDGADLFLIPEEETLLVAMSKKPVLGCEDIYNVIAFTAKSKDEFIRRGWTEDNYTFISYTRPKP